jgi:hypothetical protein
VVNVGCAEGYYAVGLARLLPDAHVYAFDTNPRAEEVCRANALLNGVASRVQVDGECTPARLEEIAVRDPNVLAIIDCEGYEKVLLTEPGSINSLRTANVVVETHDFMDRGLSPSLMSAYLASHRLSLIHAGGRNPHAFPFLDKYNEVDKWLLICENRPEQQHWLICERQQEPSRAFDAEPPGAAHGRQARTHISSILKRKSITDFGVDERGFLCAFPNPLICAVVYGEDIHYTSLKLMLNSLIEFGNYRGKIAIFSDRPSDAVLELVSSEVKNQVICFSLKDRTMAARYTIANSDLDGYSPILYIDNDIIVNRDITSILSSIAKQDGICVTTEIDLYKDLACDKITSIHDKRRIGNWFGLELMRADPECADEVLPIANSGIIGFRDHNIFRPIANLICKLYNHPVHSNLAKYFTDQPFLNYVLVKTRSGDYDILNGTCSFLGNARPFPRERRGFVHFVWARGEDKARQNEEYLRYLRLEEGSSEA